MPFAAGPADLFAAVAALAKAALPLGVVLGGGAAAAGLVALTVATRRRRPLAILGGAALGVLAAVALRTFIAAHLGLSPMILTALLAALGAGGGALAPAAFPFAVGALPGALLGAQVPLAGRAAFGAAAGGFLAGVVGLALAPFVETGFASLCGALLLVLGLLAAFGSTPLAHEIAGRPAALVGFALVVTIAGVGFQQPSATSREDRGARNPGSRS